MVKKNCQTIVVNLYGQPGAGKSTVSAELFAKLKRLGIQTELCREYAKDLVWEERHIEFVNQMSILGKQTKKLNAVIGKVDVVVTDSPLMLCAYYNRTNPIPYDIDMFDNLCYSTHTRYNNLDIFLKRTKQYEPNGRFQTEEESDNIGFELSKVYQNFDTMRMIYEDADEDCYKRIIRHLGKIRPGLFVDLNKFESVFDAVSTVDKILKSL